ncbi:hypothetical protein [Paenibacillus mesophilus]|nr:hypothetical protein [Paenibacillus mesophilus]
MKIREAKIEDAEKIAIVHVKSWKTTTNALFSNHFCPISPLKIE